MKLSIMLFSVLVAGCASFPQQASEKTKIDDCDSKYGICAYLNRNYDNSELGISLAPKTIAGDSTGTLNIKLPGMPFRQDVHVKVGDFWSFEANGAFYKLSITNIEMNPQFYDLRGGWFKFKLSR